MPVDKALSIMEEAVGSAIDPVCFSALKRALVKMEPQRSNVVAA